MTLVVTPTIADFNALAAEQLGVPYVFGGTSLKGSPRPGLDCSGLPFAVAATLGVTIPRTSEAQFAGLHRVLYGSVREGDLIFYDVPTDDQPQPAHVAIAWTFDARGFVTGVLQAPHTGEDVMVSPPLPYEIMGYGRLPFPDVAPTPQPQPEDEMNGPFVAEIAGQPPQFIVWPDGSKTLIADGADVPPLWAQFGQKSSVQLTAGTINAIPTKSA